MESGKEQNYWPGFVDALSNVVLTLVFVLVVFVFALVIASSKVNQKAQELAENAHKKAQEQIQNNQEVVHLQEELQVALDQLDAAKKINVKLQDEVLKLKRQQAILLAEAEKPEPLPVKEIEAKPAAPEERNLLTEHIKVTVDQAPEHKDDPNRDDNPLIDQGTGAIVVVFPRGVFEMTDQARTELSQALAPQKGRLSGTMITVKSIMGVESYSEAQRLAYYRGLNIRNYLMESGFGSGQTIKVLIEPAKEVDDARVEIRFNSH